MTVHAGLARREASSRRSMTLAPTCRGLNYYSIDQSVRGLLPLYMDAPLLAHLEPHLHELGTFAGSTLYDLSDQAERHQPVLHPRDGYGRDEEWVEYHPAYREMERIALPQVRLPTCRRNVGPCLPTRCGRPECLNESSRGIDPLPLMALSPRLLRMPLCPLSGEKPTKVERGVVVGFDPKRSSSGKAILNARLQIRLTSDGGNRYHSNLKAMGGNNELAVRISDSQCLYGGLDCHGLRSEQPTRCQIAN